MQKLINLITELEQVKKDLNAKKIKIRVDLPTTNGTKTIYDGDFENCVGLFLYVNKYELCFSSATKTVVCMVWLEESETQIYNKKCVGCPRARICHEECEFCDDFTDELEELEGMWDE
jgi:hypothetical protein